jgi:hypothetical protein
MKTLTKSLILVGIAAGIGGLALIPPTLAHGEKKGARFHARTLGHHGMARQSGMARHGMRLFERFDTDADGIVTQAEIDKARADIMVRFDADGDGKLSLKEYEGVWLDFMRERMVDRFQNLDRDGDAAITADEFAAPMKNIVSWIDTDDDGQLTAKELKRRRGHGNTHGGSHHERKGRHGRDDDRR